MTSEVFNTDCLDYMRSLPDKHFDLALADPPYSDAGFSEKEHRNTRGRFNKYADNQQVTPPPQWNRFGGLFDRYKSWRNVGGEVRKKIIAWDVAPPEEFFTELFRISRNQIIFGGNYFELPPCRCFLVWRKLSISEKFSMAMAEYAWTSFNDNAKVFECAPQGKKSDPRFHPTAKPVELYAWVLRNFAKPGDRIFDPMMGSGSSRIAAHKLGFDFTGCEIDKEYFDKSCERFDRECNGIYTLKDGTKVQQQKLFDSI